MTLEGGRELKMRLDAISQGRPLMGRIGLYAVREAKIRVPRRTGNLARTIRLGTVTDSSVEVRAGGQRKVGYAAAVEYGAKAHIVRPKTAKSLFFPSQKATTARFGGSARLSFTQAGRLSAKSVRRFGAGAFVHAMSARIPRQAARPFLRPAIRETAIEYGHLALIEIWNEAA